MGLKKNSDSDNDPVDVFALNRDVDVSIVLPKIIASQTTYERYKKLTEEAPWLPFRHPREIELFSALDTTEH